MTPAIYNTDAMKWASFQSPLTKGQWAAPTTHQRLQEEVAAVINQPTSLIHPIWFWDQGTLFAFGPDCTTAPAVWLSQARLHTVAPDLWGAMSWLAYTHLRPTRPALEAKIGALIPLDDLGPLGRGVDDVTPRLLLTSAKNMRPNPLKRWAKVQIKAMKAAEPERAAQWKKSLKQALS